MPAMASTPAPWDRASLTPVAADGRRVPEIVQLGPGVPDLATLFAFARDAELRFATLRLRLEERAWISGGETLRVHEVLVRHPGAARVTVVRPDRPATTNHEIWLSDGEAVRIYRGWHRLATERPGPRGGPSASPPATCRARRGPIRRSRPCRRTPLRRRLRPSRRLLPERAWRRATCRVTGTGIVAGREAIFVTSRTTRGRSSWPGDRPDHRSGSRSTGSTGLLSLLVEWFGDTVTRRVEATELTPDAVIPDSAFCRRGPGGRRLDLLGRSGFGAA